MFLTRDLITLDKGLLRWETPNLNLTLHARELKHDWPCCAWINMFSQEEKLLSHGQSKKTNKVMKANRFAELPNGTITDGSNELQKRFQEDKGMRKE